MKQKDAHRWWWEEEMVPPRRRLVIVARVEERRGGTVFPCRVVRVNSEGHSDSEWRMLDSTARFMNG